MLLQAQGKLAEADPLFKEAIEGKSSQLGATHPATLTSVNNYAGLLQAKGQLDEAEKMYRQALEGRRDQLGNHHTDTLTSINNLASVLQGKSALAKYLILCLPTSYHSLRLWKIAGSRASV